MNTFNNSAVSNRYDARFTHNKKPQIFLLHFAGGSRFSYDYIKPKLSRQFEFIPLELPGRGNRVKEKLLRTRTAAIDDYVRQIVSLISGAPFIIFGHSMGASLGLEITSKLEDAGTPPLHLIVSGNPGPGIRKKESVTRYNLSDDLFKKELQMLGGIPSAIWDDPSLFEFYSPILRADFECVERYRFSNLNLKINTPLFAVMGTEEELSDNIENWKRYTKADFQFKKLRGGHFFIFETADALAEIILACTLPKPVEAD